MWVQCHVVVLYVAMLGCQRDLETIIALISAVVGENMQMDRAAVRYGSIQML